MRLLLPCLLVLSLLTGCSSTAPEDFAGREPKLDLQTYFAGETRAWGMFHDRFGTLRRQFTVDIVGRQEGDELVLEEDFVYDDGETERRVWRIRQIDDTTYEGRAGDVIGTATGRAFGNALNWRYEMDLKVGDGTWRVSFDDWMFLQPGGTLLNRAEVRKFGLLLGTVTLAFVKPEGGDSAAGG